MNNNRYRYTTTSTGTSTVTNPTVVQVPVEKNSFLPDKTSVITEQINRIYDSLKSLDNNLQFLFDKLNVVVNSTDKDPDYSGPAIADRGGSGLSNMLFDINEYIRNLDIRVVIEIDNLEL